METVSFIGAGNVAFRMAIAFQEKGYSVPGIFNISSEKASKLVRALNSNLPAYSNRKAQETGCLNPVPTGNPSSIASSLTDLLSSDIVVVAVSDDAIPEVVETFASEIHTARRLGTVHLPIVVHTSGAADISVLAPLEEEGCRCGVFYPLLTLSKSKNVDFRDVPFLLEANDAKTLNALKVLCDSFKSEYVCCNSRERLMMHIAAVFSSNFTNYLLSLAFEISGKNHSLLLPTTIEMVRKSFLQSPEAALTGPAKRGDMKTIERHLKMLDESGLSEQKEIYSLLTEKIINRTR